MLELRVEGTRGGQVESVHRVSAAVVDADGRLLLASGTPDLVTFWRSAAKPFQALPFVADGAADRFGFADDAVALACASHSSEPEHVALAGAMLAQVGRREDDLSCGPHVPLSPVIAERVARGHVRQTPLWSNCSGKHAAMLATCLHHGWPLAGYTEAAHPLQRRIVAEIARWSDVPAESIGLGVDGCTTCCFALPLRAMALAYARLGTSAEPAATRVREAMMAHPYLVAGNERPCTDLMAAGAGTVLAKLGADGVYSAALPTAGLGIAIKVEDGDMRAIPLALLAVLRELVPVLPSLDRVLDAPEVARHAELPIRNTRGAVTGYLRARGTLHRVTTGVETVRA
ncbi:MAG TPA: asparaginase [Gemmatimonadales bacterium]|nr:asparaginase [Gemmatimonadales bacterium]